MKRILNIIYLITGLLVVVTKFLDPINKTILIIRQIAIFWFLAWTAYTLISGLSKALISKFSLTGHKESLVYFGRVLMFTLIIIAIGFFQYDFVQFTQIPYVYGSKYYDQYQNLIYQSEFSQSDPTLNIIYQDDYKLVFNVNEESSVEHVRSNVGIDEIIVLDATINKERLSTIEINYNTDHKIKSVDYRVSQYNKTLSDEGGYTYFYSAHHTIENAYINHFESTVSIADYEIRYKGLPIENLSHYDFDVQDYSQVKYYIEMQDTSEHDAMYYLVKDSTDDEDAKVTEKIAVFYYDAKDDYRSYTIDSLTLGDVRKTAHIEIVLKKDLIDYSHNFNSGNYITEQQAVYSTLSEYERININRMYKRFWASSDDDENEDVYRYKMFKQNQDNYVIEQKNKSSNLDVVFSQELFQIFDEDYGYKVSFLQYREQPYLFYLFSGEREYTCFSCLLYFDQLRLYGFSNYIYPQFNIEYQLLYNNTLGDTFYSSAPYLIFE